MNDQNKTDFSMLKLFLSMLEISTFTFGGGFVIISMMKKKYCEELHWVTDDEVLDMTSIAQSAPGALAVNSAIIFGYRIAGVSGALISTLGTILPPLVIISLVSVFYNAFATNLVVQTALQVMRAGVAAIIVDVVIELAGNVVKTKDVINIILMIGAFILSWFFGFSSISIILLFLILGISKAFVQSKKERECR
jgi:chromate transporter